VSVNNEWRSYQRFVRNRIGVYCIAGSQLIHRLGCHGVPITDDKAWVVRYLVIDTRDHTSARSRLLLAPGYINDISWSQAAVSVNMTREAVLTAPAA
jgi:hypothetical protein